jgi:hypothetical protein
MKEWQQILIGIFIIILFGYYLGITIASVVDYRLKDAIINLPEQKNTIYVNVKDTENIEQFKVNKNNKVISKKSSTPKKENFTNFEKTVKQSSDDTIVDQNQKAYALSYKLAKTLQTDNMPYQGSNSYDYDQLYSKFE